MCLDPVLRSCHVSFGMQETQKWGMEKEEEEGREVRHNKASEVLWCMLGINNSVTEIPTVNLSS